MGVDEMGSRRNGTTMSVKMGVDEMGSRRKGTTLSVRRWSTFSNDISSEAIKPILSI